MPTGSPAASRCTRAETPPPLRNGALAMTFARLPNGAFSVELAREQADGTWLWAIDQLNLAPPKS